MGTYTLWVRTAGSEPIGGDVAANTTTTGLVKVGESVAGRIERPATMTGTK